MTTTIQRAVVIAGHTLGAVMQTEVGGLEVQILRASVLRGAPASGDSNDLMGVVSFDPARDDFREATEQDFRDFRVVSHPSYFSRVAI